MRGPSWLFLLLLALPGQAAAQASDSVALAAGSRYVARGPLSWLSKWLAGSRYRDLWGTPLTLPRLDPSHGYTMIGADTGMRAGFLYFRDNAGATWTFRPLDRELAGLVAPARREELVNGFLQDLQSGRHPGAPPVVDALSRGAGLGGVDQRLVALATDSGLVAGMFERGIDTRFRDELDERGSAITSAELVAQLDGPNPPAVDAMSYLRERLFDIYLSSWDPLPEEWLWARRGGTGLLRPLPRERDGAFSRFDGLLTSLARKTTAELSSFEEGYDNKLPMTGRLRILDRRLLTALDSARWNLTTRDLVSRLSDSVIAQAVGHLPPEYQVLNGARLLRELQVRRDGLPRMAERYRAYLLDRGELYGTTQADTILARRPAKDVLDVSIGDRVPVRFESKVTDEVRLYPMGGRDHIVVRGPAREGPRLRIAVDSLDTIDSSGGGPVDLNPRLAVPAFNDSLDQPAPLHETRSRIAPWFTFNSDLGILIGAGPVYTTYDPGYDPWKQRIRLRAGFATAPGNGAVEFRGEFRRRHSQTYVRMDARISSIDVLKFYGFGNETPRTESSDFYKTGQRQGVLAPTLVTPGPLHSTVEVGIIGKRVSTNLDNPTLISEVKPYGTEGHFLQLGAQAAVRYDTRDSPTFAHRGTDIRIATTAYPGILSADEAFGMVEGSVSQTVTPLHDLTLAVRMSGKQTWGKYPVHEAAYLGGSRTLRGLNAQRYAGDAAVWGNFDSRLRLATLPFVLNWDFGVLGLADVGRVYYDDEQSNRWHSGFGGGVWAALPDRSFMGLLDIVKGDDNHISFWVGAAFIL